MKHRELSEACCFSAVFAGGVLHPECVMSGCSVHRGGSCWTRLRFKRAEGARGKRLSTVHLPRARAHNCTGGQTMSAGSKPTPGEHQMVRMCHTTSGGNGPRGADNHFKKEPVWLETEEPRGPNKTEEFLWGQGSTELWAWQPWTLKSSRIIHTSYSSCSLQHC